MRYLLSLIVLLLLHGCTTKVVEYDLSEKEPSWSSVRTTPLVAIKLEEKSTARFPTDEQYTKVFGEELPRYINNISNGKVNPSFEGVYGPYSIPSRRISAKEKIYQAIELADEDIDYSRFDKDDDKIVRPDELTIIVLANGGQGRAGAARYIEYQSDHVRIHSRHVITGHKTNLATFAHEYSHTFGAFDLYGSGCNNNNTLMGCTIPSFGFLKTDYKPRMDPFHAVRFNWLDAQEASIYQKGCYSISTEQPLKISYSDKEYFIVERFDEEFFVWSIRLNKHGHPIQIPSLYETEKTDPSIFTIGPEDTRRLQSHGVGDEVYLERQTANKNLATVKIENPESVCLY